MIAEKPVRPGGALTTRPLNFIWICDCSGSMGLDGKIQALNTAVRKALPHMRLVAEENPNAGVFIRTLRFSKGARWLQSQPVAVDQFRWTDLVADDVPRTAAFAAEFRNRLEREGAQTGDVQVSLIWNNYNDLDLHVICPHGEEIYFGARESECGGELDVDMNVSPTSEEPVENVYWPSGGAAQGHYKVCVHHYRNHSRPGCKDPTHFKVAIKMGGLMEEFSDKISYGEQKLIHEFDLDNKILASKGGGGNTDMGAALQMIADVLRMPPMELRALPPVLVLISDGQPTDDFDKGLNALLAQPWGKKSVRIAIAIGQDAEHKALQKFIGHAELAPLQANNPETLVKYIKWASTAVLKSASAPASRTKEEAAASGANVAIPQAPAPVPSDAGPGSAGDVW